MCIRDSISTEMHKMLRENIDSSCDQFLAGDVKDDWDFGACLLYTSDTPC